MKLELGGGRNPLSGYKNLDLCETADFKVNLQTVGSGLERLPFDDDSVEAVYSSHCLEHLQPYGGLLHEIVRVCHVGAVVEIRTPHHLSDMAMCAGHRHVVSPTQIDHWCSHFVQDWFGTCAKRLRHDRTEVIANDRYFHRARRAFPMLSDNDIFDFVPNTAHENRFLFTVVINEQMAVTATDWSKMMEVGAK